MQSFFKKLLTAIMIFITSPLIFSNVVYARIGSTGGGHIHMESHTGSYMGHGSASDINLMPLLRPLYIKHGHFLLYGFIIDLVLAGFIAAIIIYLLVNVASPDKEHYTILSFIAIWLVCAINPILFGVIIILAMFKSKLTVVDTSDYVEETILTPNLSLHTFKQILKQDNITLSTNFEINSDFLVDRYSKLQYLYSQILRQYLTGNHDTSSLMEYVTSDFYDTIVNEIKLKVKNQTIDDVIVNKAEILEVGRFNNYIIAKIECVGQDNEAQANANFDSSFKQAKWIDYVVFDDYKIANIIYGEHFHVNGKDYNHQQGLNGAFEEHDLRDDEHDMFK